MDWRLETVVVPVSDVDRAKAFYADAVGFRVDADHSASEDFRVVQLTPSGSGCSISLMRNEDAAGTLQGLQLVVRDIDEARRLLLNGGVDIPGIVHFEDGSPWTGPARTGRITRRSCPSAIPTGTAGWSKRSRAGPAERLACWGFRRMRAPGSFGVWTTARPRRRGPRSS